MKNFIFCAVSIKELEKKRTTVYRFINERDCYTVLHFSKKFFLIFSLPYKERITVNSL